MAKSSNSKLVKALGIGSGDCDLFLSEGIFTETIPENSEWTASTNTISQMSWILPRTKG